MEKQDEEAGGKTEAEDAIAPEGLPEQPRRSGKEREVEQEADGSELGEHRQRCRVRCVLRGAAACLQLLRRRERLAADAHAGDRVVGDDVPGDRYEARAAARGSREPVVLHRCDGERARSERHRRGNGDDDVSARPLGKQNGDG